MMTPEDHKRTRRLAAKAIHGNLTMLAENGWLNQEGSESYVAGLLDGATQFLTETMRLEPSVVHDILADATGRAAARLAPAEAV